MCVVVEKRNGEVARLAEDLERLGKQLEAATIAKAEASRKIEELMARDIEVNVK